MKILIASAKTQKLEMISYNEQQILFKNTHNEVNKIITELSYDQKKNFYKCSNKILDNLIDNQSKNLYGTSFFSFDGLVYKNAKKDITENNYNYIFQHVMIIDALYGILLPFTNIKNYRLDFNMRIKDKPKFYDFWDSEVNNYLKNEVIVNLMSKEFYKLISQPMINIVFEQIISGKRKSQSTHCKIARGTYLNWLIINNIENVKDLVNFDLLDYKYDKLNSSISILTFVKNVS